MMNAMVLGRIEDVLKRSEVSDDLGVDPELDEEVELGVNDRVSWRNEERHRQVEKLSKFRSIQNFANAI